MVDPTVSGCRCEISLAASQVFACTCVCNTLRVFLCVSGVKMRKFAYCKVVLATSLVWVMLDMFILLYFSECNKCDDKKERGLPGRDSEYTHAHSFVV